MQSLTDDNWTAPVTTTAETHIVCAKGGVWVFVGAGSPTEANAILLDAFDTTIGNTKVLVTGQRYAVKRRFSDPATVNIVAHA